MTANVKLKFQNRGASERAFYGIKAVMRKNNHIDYTLL